MSEAILEVIVNNILDIVIAVLSIVVSVYLVPLIKDNLKPWLEEKRIYGLVEKFVEAAEKLAESGAIAKIEKKETVIKWLEGQGITVTDKVEAFVEAAVKNLDIITGTIVDSVKNENTEIETSTNE